MEIKVTIQLSPAFEEQLTKLLTGLQEQGGIPVQNFNQPLAAPGAVPVSQAPLPPCTPVQPVNVPVAPLTYTQEQLARAAGMLMDAGKRDQLVNLLNGRFGVQALTMLPKDQYGAFATELRQLGAQI